MTDDAKEGGCVILGVIILLLVIGALTVIWKNIECGSRWQDYENRYSVTAGCQIKIDGKWTPEDRIREFVV